ncbi:hypothetical protein DPMN_048322 [Dreissena polymorpha]|uniref:Uncharacterized protein n=1 Tax=Dreissena polymorpha TaxID=45954 RepID=A0A9D4DBE3_DREPO|nr:hypothetical protein DPMN_048322 [Dreissena polymorpha]
MTYIPRKVSDDDFVTNTMADSDLRDGTGKKRSRKFSYRENEVLQECIEKHFKRLIAKHASGGNNVKQRPFKIKCGPKSRTALMRWAMGRERLSR